MKRINILSKILSMALVVLGLLACEEFLDRPTIDNYNVDNFYQTDEQCFQAVNPIYNSPWYDFQRGFFKIGEVLSGNFYWGASPYMTFTINSTDQDLVNMSASLWAVNAYCNGTLENIDLKAGPDVSEETKLTVKGEALVWKAMAYFYLVRIFGEVPIVHSNSAEISEGDYNNKYKATIPNIYDYIIMTLEQAIEWLPEKNEKGRIDRYSAYGLLSKVYLTKSGYGLDGSRNTDDLQKAAQYALKVINNSGRDLLPVYSDVFRLESNDSQESLLAWKWKASRDPWTQNNSLQSDLALPKFSEFADTWGGYNGPSVDLQDAFNENALSLNRENTDRRRKATMMMYSDNYDYFWADKGGFDWADFCLNELNEIQSPTGANCVKHLVGNNNDHVLGIGYGMQGMATSLSTHLLRLSDVYLIYAEAVLGNDASSSDAKALEVFNQVRARAYGMDYAEFVGTSLAATSLSFDKIWKERRLELACEGDRWYDYVRLHYYKPQEAIAELKAQRRSSYTGLFSFYESGTLDTDVTYYDKNPVIPNITDDSFTLPFPDTDLTMNKHLMEPAVEHDISEYSY
ncbi:RagB/SusD family nutrient uptake outer membrane protein [Draconibacterium sediminis]|uniref:RagB/SusD family nutrient uptake outer membrane protein n=1 Tax=Draconibacterium sediminis TaxID=1544798 RepID=UPI0026E96678|nr:RagB/SusD family nutrient uptake outer membrane protein [Draconibacterium sediminis]